MTANSPPTALGVPADGARILMDAGLPPNHCSAPVIARFGLKDRTAVQAAAACYEALQGAIQAGQIDPADKQAAYDFLAGAAGAELAHRIMDTVIEEARIIEAESAVAAASAVDAYQEADQGGKILHGIPVEPMFDERGVYTGYTRAQVRDLRKQHQSAIRWYLSIGERAVVRGVVPPAILILLAVVISGMESWLITSRLVDFSIYNVTSWVMLMAFGLALFLATHYFTKSTGGAIAESRESLRAMREVTTVGVAHLVAVPLVDGSAESNPTGVQLAARANSTDPAEARRHMLQWLSVVGPLATIYAGIAFMRIFQMATRLPGYLPGFPVLVAVLFAGVAVGLLGLITYWESNRSFLGEDTAHVTMVDSTTTDREHNVRAGIMAQLKLGAQLHTQADELLVRAHTIRVQGIETVGRAFQGLSLVCNLPEVVKPNPEFLFQYEDPHARRAKNSLSLVDVPKSAAEEALEKAVDYTPEIRMVSGWYLRTMDRDGPAIGAYLDPARLEVGSSTPSRLRIGADRS